MENINEDSIRKLFNSGSVKTIQINCVYINENKSIVKCENFLYLLKTENLITRDELVSIIKKQRCQNNINHSVFSILKYNFDLDTNNISHFLEDDITQSNIYLTSLKRIEDIQFNNTILFFHDINELVIIFHENKLYSNKTKRVYITHPHKKTHKRPVDDVNKVI
jgi:hypothetical protein